MTPPVGNVFRTFLKLGLTSFGGPVAHLGYFRQEIVTRQRWIDEAGYSDLVALCQFLPGPTSSQIGFSLGLLRAGPLGALAAWCAFTLPSAILLVLFAFSAASMNGPIGTSIIHSLKVVTVAIVAQAVIGMARTLCPDRQRIAIAIVAALLVVTISGFDGQLAAIVGGAVAGFWLCRQTLQNQTGHLQVPVSNSVGIASLSLYAVLLALLPIIVTSLASQPIALFSAFYRAGALVFGGGHVVLPLLETAVVQPGWVSRDVFLAGYGAVQAVPGPLFTFAAFLGAATTTGWPRIAMAAICLLAIFLPAMLLVVGVLPFWDSFRTRPYAQAIMRGANASVVGLLFATFCTPIATSALQSIVDVVFSLLGILLLVAWKRPSWMVVMLLVVGEMITRWLQHGL